MQNVFPLVDDRVMFARDMPVAANQLLQQAVAAYEDTEQAETLLWKAQRMAPDRLEVYTALYKFYFYKNRLEEAENVTRMSLQKAAEIGGFDEDWTHLIPESADWFRSDGPERQYLYSLKALGFIRLRRGDAEGGRGILAVLKTLDPLDQVGGSVIEYLADAVCEA